MEFRHTADRNRSRGVCELRGTGDRRGIGEKLRRDGRCSSRCRTNIERGAVVASLGLACRLDEEAGTEGDAHAVHLSDQFIAFSFETADAPARNYAPEYSGRRVSVPSAATIFAKAIYGIRSEKRGSTRTPSSLETKVTAIENTESDRNANAISSFQGEARSSCECFVERLARNAASRQPEIESPSPDFRLRDPFRHGRALVA